MYNTTRDTIQKNMTTTIGQISTAKDQYDKDVTKKYMKKVLDASKLIWVTYQAKLVRQKLANVTILADIDKQKAAFVNGNQRV